MNFSDQSGDASRKEYVVSTIKVAMIGGSSRPKSLNERLARAIEKLAPTNLISERIRIDDLFFSDSDWEKAPSP